MTVFEEKVYSSVKRVPEGKVTTYEEIARASGRPGAFRAVGNALNKNPHAPEVPCHRVVKSDGCLGGFARGTPKKRKILEEEGVLINKGKIVDFLKILYTFN